MSETQPHYDDQIFKEFYFTRTESSSTPEIASNSVLVACQPPWVLSSEDMWQFTELQSVSRDHYHRHKRLIVLAACWQHPLARERAPLVQGS